MNGFVSIRKGKSIRMAAWPNMACTMALIVLACTPYLGQVISNAVRLGLFGLWVLSTVALNPITGKEKGFGIAVWIIVYLGLQMVYSIVGVSREIEFFLARCYIYVIPVALVYMINYYNTQEIKFIWVFFVLAFCINLADNIYIGITQGETAFLHVGEGDRTNAGKTNFVVGCMLFIGIFWMVFRRSARKKMKIFSVLLMLAAAYYMLLLNTRATSLFTLLLILAGYIMIEFGRNKKMSTLKMVFRLMLIAITFYVFMAPILSSLLDLFSDNERMLRRLNDVSSVIDGESMEDLGEGSLYARRNLWMASIETFVGSVPNFLFGVGESVFDTDYFSLIAKGVGGHSEFFDLSARYGVIGIFIYSHIVKHSHSFINKLTDDGKVKQYMLVVFISVLVTGFVNNLSNSITTISIIYIMLPLTVALLQQKQL